MSQLTLENLPLKKSTLAVVVNVVIGMVIASTLVSCSSPHDSGENESQQSQHHTHTPNLTEALPSIASDTTNTAVKEAISTDMASGEIERTEEIIVTGAYSVRHQASANESTMFYDGSYGIPYNRPNIESSSENSSEKYDDFDDNGIKRVSSNPVSTFSIDVDTGAYSNARRFLNNGQLPPEDAVRTEEFINYFAYHYPAQTEDNSPFSINTEISTSPYNSGKHLLHIGIQAVETNATEIPDSNLVFLVDVSGSMNSPDKLELLKTSLKMLSRQLRSEDKISLVVYAGASGVVLEPTEGNNTQEITEALNRLQAGGSTNGAAGIQLAYSLAKKSFIEDGINRVILATDGDFNVGTTDFDSLIDLIEDKRESGISLTTLGFGSGNYNDHLMEQLADAGNGNHAYIDNINEARKVLVDELSSTLQTVAKDVKIQIEFNPAVVSEYRLIGYENRILNQEDFNNDKVDAGEIGAGHTVTALYEISLTSSNNQSIDPLRYSSQTGDINQMNNIDVADLSNELAFLKLRYKAPDGDRSQLVQRPLYTSDIVEDISQTSETWRFSAAVAGFAQILRDNNSVQSLEYDEILTLAGNAKGKDEFGYRSEFINLVKTAQALAVH